MIFKKIPKRKSSSQTAEEFKNELSKKKSEESAISKRTLEMIDALSEKWATDPEHVDFSNYLVTKGVNIKKSPDREVFLAGHYLIDVTQGFRKRYGEEDRTHANELRATIIKAHEFNKKYYGEKPSNVALSFFFRWRGVVPK
jgi:hypothetical protein